MKIEMLKNGMDSLQKGFDAYLRFTEGQHAPDPAIDYNLLLKQAILSTHHGVEILLKQILRNYNDMLIIDKPDDNYIVAYKEVLDGKASSVFLSSKSEKIHTITYATALERVCEITNAVEDSVKTKLSQLDKIRNALTHAETEIDDQVIQNLFDGLILALDVLFCQTIGEEYQTVYGFTKLKTNYNNYMKYYEDNKMDGKKRAFEALYRALEKSKILAGENQCICIEDANNVRSFLRALQSDENNIMLGMDMYNNFCSGDVRIAMNTDGIVSMWATDNHDLYIIKFASMVLYIPDIQSKASPIFVLEADNYPIPVDKKNIINNNGSLVPEDSILEAIVINKPEGKKYLYTDKDIRNFYSMIENGDYETDPDYYTEYTFYNRRIFAAINIQGAEYGNLNRFLNACEGKTGNQVATLLSESIKRELAERKGHKEDKSN